METTTPRDIAYTVQQAKSFAIHHAEMFEMAEAEDAWNDFMHMLEAHKDYCADIDPEYQEAS